VADHFLCKLCDNLRPSGNQGFLKVWILCKIGTYGASISDDAEPHNHVSGATAFYVIVLARQVAKLLQVCANNLLPTASLQSAHTGVFFLPEVAFLIVVTFSKAIGSNAV